MEKNELLSLIRSSVTSKTLSKQDLLTAYEDGIKAGNIDHGLLKELSASEILYVLGGSLVFLGITFLVFLNWKTLDPVFQIFITLFVSLIAYLIGTALFKNEKLDSLGQTFHLISALIMPVGLYVFFDKIHIDIASKETQIIIASILFSVQIISYTTLKKLIFLLFSIVFASLLYFNLTNLLFSGYSPKSTEFESYRILILSCAYILLGYFFSKSQKFPLSGPLYGIGIVGFLSSALFLGNWSPKQNIFWEIIYPFLTFGIIFSSIYLKVKSFLTFGSLFLIIYIIKITLEYFKSGIEWPIALIISGISLMTVGFLAFYLNKKYFS